MKGLPPELIDAVRSHTAVGFAGVGLGTLAGAPSWPDLLLGLAHDAERNVPEARRAIARAVLDAESGRPEAAAEALSAVLGDLLPMILTRQITMDSHVLADLDAVTAAAAGHEDDRHMLARSPGTNQRWMDPTQAHRLLVRLGLRAVISTGYDRALDTAAADRRVSMPTLVASYPNLAAWIGRRPPLLKLHGDIENRHDLVVTRSAHRAVVELEGIRTPMLTVCEGATPLLVGYNPEDPDLWYLVEECLPRWKLAPGFCLVAGAELDFAERLAEHNVRALSLESPEALSDALQQLAEAAGVRIGFTIRADVTCHDARDALSYGMQLANNLSRLEGPVTYGSAVPGPRVVVEMEADAATFGRLLDRLRAWEPGLKSILGRGRVLAFDEIPLSWRLQPADGAFN